jgi:TatD DNase family protein
MKLIDTHCHLDFDRYEEDFEEVLTRADAAGVGRMMTIGCATSVADADAALKIARAHPERLRATVGAHPHDAQNADRAVLDEIERLADDPFVRAIGEMGLDFHYDNSPRDAQREAFRAQIAIARRVKKPIVVHTRAAPVETLQILREENANDVGGIIHCFSEDAAFAAAALDLGFVASFSGLVTFSKNVDGIRDAAAKQPDDAILLETDAPYLSPHPHRGKRNEPANVAHIAACIAELRGVDVNSIAELTTANAERVLRWPSSD